MQIKLAAYSYHLLARGDSVSYATEGHLVPNTDDLPTAIFRGWVNEAKQGEDLVAVCDVDGVITQFCVGQIAPRTRVINGSIYDLSPRAIEHRQPADRADYFALVFNYLESSPSGCSAMVYTELGLLLNHEGNVFRLAPGPLLVGEKYITLIPGAFADRG